jgi:hypothetical protein
MSLEERERCLEKLDEGIRRCGQIISWRLAGEKKERNKVEGVGFFDDVLARWASPFSQGRDSPTFALPTPILQQLLFLLHVRLPNWVLLVP